MYHDGRDNELLLMMRLYRFVAFAEWAQIIGAPVLVYYLAG